MKGHGVFTRLPESDEAVSLDFQWADNNLVSYNVSQNAGMSIFCEKKPFDLTPTFLRISVPVTESLEILGITLSASFNFDANTASKRQTVVKTLDILNKVKRYFSLLQSEKRYLMYIASFVWNIAVKCRIIQRNIN